MNSDIKKILEQIEKGKFYDETLLEVKKDKDLDMVKQVHERVYKSCQEFLEDEPNMDSKDLLLTAAMWELCMIQKSFNQINDELLAQKKFNDQLMINLESLTNTISTLVKKFE